MPENNKRYWWQFVYIIFGIGCLASNENDFSFFPLFTFVAPVLIDLLGNKVEYRVARWFRTVFIIINVTIVLICFCGWYGVMIDTGNAFSVNNNAMVFPGASIPKTVFLVAILPHVGVPAMYSFVSPCKAGAILPEVLLNRKKEGVQ